MNGAICVAVDSPPAFAVMYPDNTLRKMFFDVAEEYQPQAEEMLIDYRDNMDKSLNKSCHEKRTI